MNLTIKQRALLALGGDISLVATGYTEAGMALWDSFTPPGTHYAAHIQTLVAEVDKVGGLLKADHAEGTQWILTGSVGGALFRVLPNFRKFDVGEFKARWRGMECIGELGQRYAYYTRRVGLRNKVLVFNDRSFVRILILNHMAG